MIDQQGCPMSRERAASGRIETGLAVAGEGNAR
jgi:hypothetical protein